MDVSAVLDRLTALGVTVDVDGDELVLRPGSLVPDLMLEEVRTVKPELLAYLQLLERLRRGTEWLTTVNAELLALPDAGVGSGQEREFCHGLELWDHLEKLLRLVYPDYTDCILGPGHRCPAAAPVRCAACGTLAAVASHT